MADYPLADVLVSMSAFFLFVGWVGCLIFMFHDIFRSPELTGAKKAGWTLLVFLLPFLGVLLYLVVRGGGMHDRDLQEAVRRERARQQFLRGDADIIRRG